ncbi:MAG: NUDIX domain-containing protein [Gemmatales bacterium]|nr:NUDIX domain-containing protein [Gemmatales bacterium]MDW8387973.1 NUDIX domain-containing protein [Gemmatales bacterium]
MLQSAGTLLYRITPNGLEVLIVHPSGAYNRGKPWSIPKGELDGNESLEEAARRETFEETGLRPGPLVPLGSVRYQKSRKVIHGFAGPAPAQEPQCASWEIDAAEFVPVEKARALLHPDQVAFLDRFMELWQKGELPLSAEEPSVPTRQ